LLHAIWIDRSSRTVTSIDSLTIFSAYCIRYSSPFSLSISLSVSPRFISPVTIKT
jgi:hypothetical protein